MSFPKYSNYREIGIEWIRSVPDHWDIVPMKRLLSFENGTDHKNVQSTEGVPVYGSGGIFAYANAYLYDGESILFGRKGTIDKPLHVKGKFWTVDTMYYTKLREGIDGRFGYFMALCFPFGYYSTNTALPSLTKSDLESHKVAIPPLDEQHRLAKFLDRETAKIDALVAEQERLIELLKEKRQAVISHAVTKGLDPDVSTKDSGAGWIGSVPDHWQPLRLKFAVRLNPSKSEAAKIDRFEEVSFLPMEAIGEDGSISLEYSRPIAEVETGYTYFRDGDVTIAKITPCFENGKGAVMQGLLGGIGFGTTELIVARPLNNKVSAKFLHSIFKSDAFRGIGQASMYGAGGQKRVPDDFVRNFRAPIPPLSEQLAIQNFIDSETAKIDALAVEHKHLIDLLEERRSALISATVTGQIDVRQLEAA